MEIYKLIATDPKTQITGESFYIKKDRAIEDAKRVLSDWYGISLLSIRINDFEDFISFSDRYYYDLTGVCIWVEKTID